MRAVNRLHGIVMPALCPTARSQGQPDREPSSSASPFTDFDVMIPFRLVSRAGKADNLEQTVQFS